MDLTDMVCVCGLIPPFFWHKSVTIFSQYGDGVRFPYKVDNSLTRYKFISFPKQSHILWV
jgi:hypothetical protein